MAHWMHIGSLLGTPESGLESAYTGLHIGIQKIFDMSDVRGSLASAKES